MKNFTKTKAYKSSKNVSEEAKNAIGVDPKITQHTYTINMQNKKEINPFEEIQAGLKKACGDYTENKKEACSWEDEFDEMMANVLDIPIDRGKVWGFKIATLFKSELKSFISKLLSQERKKVVEELIKFKNNNPAWIRNGIDEFLKSLRD
jgi:hypothetical protein